MSSAMWTNHVLMALPLLLPEIFYLCLAVYLAGITLTHWLDFLVWCWSCVAHHSCLVATGWCWACSAYPAWVPWGCMQHQLWVGWSELTQHQGFLSFPLIPTVGRLWADETMGEQMCRSHYSPPNSEDNGLSIDLSVVTSKTHIKVIEISSIQ